MGEKSINAALIKLRESLANTDEINEETLSLAQDLEQDIQQILNKDQENPEIESVMDLALALETRFESEHPVAAGLVREIINALHKMGI